jgi:hypothetical protein
LGCGGPLGHSGVPFPLHARMMNAGWAAPARSAIPAFDFRRIPGR